MAQDEANEQQTNAGVQAETDVSQQDAENLVDLVIAASEARQAAVIETPARIDGVMLGRLLGIETDGQALVDWPGCPVQGGQKARAMAPMSPDDVGRGVALLFEGADPAKPVVMGLLFEGPQTAASGAVIQFSLDGTQATMDGERVVLSAEKEIVLQCGEASITLTRAGKIILRGEYISSRSSGVNRIQGGSVQIN